MRISIGNRIELRAHVWWMADIPGSELEFQSGDTVVSRYSGQEQTDTWALENNQLRAAQNDTSEEEDVASIVRVARCNGRLMTVVLNNGSDRYTFWTDPERDPKLGAVRRNYETFFVGNFGAAAGCLRQQ